MNDLDFEKIKIAKEYLVFFNAERNLWSSVYCEYERLILEFCETKNFTREYIEEAQDYYFKKLTSSINGNKL
jgi:hypothetical protein